MTECNSKRFRSRRSFFDYYGRWRGKPQLTPSPSVRIEIGGTRVWCSCFVVFLVVGPVEEGGQGQSGLGLMKGEQKVDGEENLCRRGSEKDARTS